MSIYRLSSSVQHPSVFSFHFPFQPVVEALVPRRRFSCVISESIQVLNLNDNKILDSNQIRVNFRKPCFWLFVYLIFFFFVSYLCTSAQTPGTELPQPNPQLTTPTLISSRIHFVIKETLIFSRIDFILENLNPSVRFSTQGAKKGTTSITLRGFSVVPNVRTGCLKKN